MDEMGGYDMNASGMDNVDRPCGEPKRDDALASREAVSALADGQLRGADFAAAVQSLSNDAGLRSSWHAYHLVGEVLRAGQGSASGADPAFAARVMARLATQDVPRPGQVAAVAVAVAVAIEKEPNNPAPTRATAQTTVREAANNPVFRWKMVAGLATLVALGSVGWNLLDAARPPAPAAMLAQQVPPPQLLRDPQLDELLAAHEQSGAVSALQMPAGFLRNATFSGRGR